MGYVSSDIFLAAVSIAAALGFLLYGGRLFLMLQVTLQPKAQALDHLIGHLVIPCNPSLCCKPPRSQAVPGYALLPLMSV